MIRLRSLIINIFFNFIIEKFLIRTLVLIYAGMMGPLVDVHVPFLPGCVHVFALILKAPNGTFFTRN
jgi:hypothetical protein